MDLKECIKIIVDNTDTKDLEYQKLYDAIGYIKTSIDEFRMDESQYIAKLYMEGKFNDIQNLSLRGETLTNASNELQELLNLFNNKNKYNIKNNDCLKLAIVENNICPVCHIRMDNSKNLYKTGNDNKVLNTYHCSNCRITYVNKNTLQSITKNIDINNTNIIIEKDYTKSKKNEHEYIYFHDVIVLKTIRNCIIAQHAVKDVIAYVNVVDNDGKITKQRVVTTYCPKCNKFYMLKSEFDKINGIVLCRIIDETKINKTFASDFNMSAAESKMHEYGYNVNVNSQLPQKQRQIILSSLIESNIMSKNEILSHLQTLIERGTKIPNWKEAVQKWKDDYKFISNYDMGDLSEISIDKFILKYSVND